MREAANRRPADSTTPTADIANVCECVLAYSFLFIILVRVFACLFTSVILVQVLACLFAPVLLVRVLACLFTSVILVSSCEINQINHTTRRKKS